jgi:hypothetical protein
VIACEELGGLETVMMTLLLAPFQAALRMIHPVGRLCAVTVKTAELAPCDTVALALTGSLKAGLLAERLTVIAPAAFESATVHVLLAPTVNEAGEQVSDTSVGVDHNARLTVLDVVPRVAPTVAEVSAEIVPAAAVKPALLLPAATATLAGTPSSGELELSVTVTPAETVCDNVTVHVADPADINPLTAHASELTCTVGTKEMETALDELL